MGGYLLSDDTIVAKPYAALLKVHVVKYRPQYYATNRLGLTAPEVRGLYHWRHAIEEVIKFLKSQLSLEACQAGYTRSSTGTHRKREGVQAHHIALCLTAYLILERERLGGLPVRGDAQRSL